jgi:hypothetical protein
MTMKKLIPLLFLLTFSLAPQPEHRAEAQEVISFNTTALRQARTERLRVWHNVTTCKTWAQPANCTSLPDIPDPANPLGPQIPNPNKLYADSTAGRSALIKDYSEALLMEVSDPRIIAAKRWLKWDSSTQAEKDAYCAMNELSAGCNPFAR